VTDRAVYKKTAKIFPGKKPPSLPFMRYDIFPTPVWHIEDAPQQLVDELYQGAYKFKEIYASVTRSNEGGYQTPPLEWKDFHPQGREYIENSVSECMDRNYKVEEWWYNINGKGNWNTPHSHAGSDFALVFYVTDSDGLLRFMNPNNMRRTEEEKDFAHMNAKKGDIIIFPSDLQHYVLPNEREEDRISISMNLQLC